MLNETAMGRLDSLIEGHRQEIIDTVCALVEIESLAGAPAPGAPYGPGPRRALERALALCRDKGLEVADYEGHCGSALLPGTGAGEIALVAHLDVVPPGEGWSAPPFSPRVRDGYIIGRGARDNKGAFAACLFTLQCLRELDVPLRHSLRLLLGCNEESGMADMDYYLSRHPAPDFALVSDCSFPLCHGEKGGFSGDIVFPPFARISRLRGGVVRNTVAAAAAATVDAAGLDPAAILARAAAAEGISATAAGDAISLTAAGVACHAAFPEGSCNAIGRLLGFLAAAGVLAGAELERARFLEDVLTRYYGEPLGIACQDEAMGKLTCVGGLLFQEGGAMHLNLDIRYPASTAGAFIAQQVKAACEAHGCAFVPAKDSPGYFLPLENPAVQCLWGVYRRLTGSTRAPYTMGGGTYARRFPAAVAFGPGDPGEQLPFGPGRGDAHQPDEAQEIGALLRAIKIYVAALLELDAVL